MSNPFENLPARQQDSSLINVEQQRAIQQVQAAMVIAKRFPRNQKEAMDRILQACTMPELAQKALYTVKKDKKETDQPGIRLAEVVAANWGNMDYGLVELSQSDGMSTVQAFAHDLETNTKQTKTFQVPHVRYSKTYGNKVLTTPDDIYSAVANYGMRRVRACIIGIIPPDVFVAAQKQVEETLQTAFEVTPKLIQSVVDKFAEFGITKAMIEARIIRRIDTMTPALMAQLGKIYNSLKDGISKPEDWFQPEPENTAPLSLKEKMQAEADPQGMSNYHATDAVVSESLAWAKDPNSPENIKFMQQFQAMREQMPEEFKAACKALKIGVVDDYPIEMARAIWKKVNEMADQF